MNVYLSEKNQDLVSVAKQHAKAYQNAFPFANISFDNFFNPNFLNLVLDEFPNLEKENSVKFQDTKQVKFAGKGELFFGDETKKFMHFLNSAPFLEFLQVLTGIKEPLIGDPYFIGGGQHEIKKGGLLKIHADFNKHAKLDLDRRINVLIYLNKDWKEEYGGHFELWDTEMAKCEKKILPSFNTMAIFSTTDFSYHGHPDPLNCPEERSRKSLALYYYTNGRPQHEIVKDQEKHSTLFKSRVGNDKDDIAFKPRNNYDLESFVKDLTPPIILKAVKGILGKK